MPTLYRILRESVLTRVDLESKLARCQPRKGSELQHVELWAGISMFDTPQRPARIARSRKIGALLGEFEVPNDHPLVVLSPPTHNGHVTVWACADLLSSFFRRYLPIS